MRDHAWLWITRRKVKPNCETKASAKYQKCTFANTGKLNQTLDIPGLFVGVLCEFWVSTSAQDKCSCLRGFGAFHWKVDCNIVLVRTGAAGSFLRRTQIYTQDASILGWTCGNLIAPAGSAAVPQLPTNVVTNGCKPVYSFINLYMQYTKHVSCGSCMYDRQEGLEAKHVWHPVDLTSVSIGAQWGVLLWPFDRQEDHPRRDGWEDAGQILCMWGRSSWQTLNTKMYDIVLED